MNGWQIFEQICEWGWIVALVLLFVFVIYLVATLLHFKTAVVGNAKRLYERPVNSVKTLTATGKAIVQQEQVRVKHMAGAFKVTAGEVKEAATEVKSAAQSVHPQELKAAVTNVQRTFQFVSMLTQFTRSSAKQTAARTKT